MIPKFLKTGSVFGVGAGAIQNRSGLRISPNDPEDGAVTSNLKSE
jgi:hypothetical protein